MDIIRHENSKHSLGRQLVMSLLGASVLLLAFELWLNDLIAMPLRVVSTSISQGILEICGFEVMREGTSLVIDTIRFNVETACSGSQTLQVMLVVSVIIVGVWQGMSLLQRVCGVLVAVVLAVLINGLRVGALILSCLYTGTALEEDTVAHQLIGVVAYLLALFIFLKACKFIFRLRFLAVRSLLLELLLAVLLVMVIFLPFVYATISSWKGREWNPYNEYAYIFVIIAFGLYLFSSLKQLRYFLQAGALWRDKVIGIFVVALGLSWALIVTRMGFVSVQGVGLIVFIFGLLIMIHGFVRAFLQLPVLVILALSFVRLPLVLTEIFGLQDMYGWFELLLLRLGMTVVLAGVYLFCYYKGIIGSVIEVEHVAKCRVGGAVFFLLLVYLGAGLLWQVEGQSEQSTAAGENLFTELPLSLGIWQGHDVMLKARTEELVGGAEPLFRVYLSDYTLPIETLSNSAGGDRHDLHPPEYCLTGAGWNITQQKTLRITAKNGSEFPITIMELENDGDIRWFAFWFYDGIKVRASYLHMLGEDLLARIKGERLGWSIYRVIAEREEDLLEFLNVVIEHI